MATVDSWFDDFAVRLCDRVRRADWPLLGSEFWDEFKRSLVRHGVTEDVAYEAASELAEEPPKFVGDLIPAFRKAVQTVWKRSEVEGSGSPHGTFAEASAASRNCRDCGGSGFASVYHETIAYQPFSAICECAAGRWQYDRLTRDHPESSDRLIRLLDVKSGMTRYALERPPIEALTDASGTPMVEVRARNGPPRSATGRRPFPSGLGKLVPVVPIEPRPVAAVATNDGAAVEADIGESARSGDDDPDDDADADGCRGAQEPSRGRPTPRQDAPGLPGRDSRRPGRPDATWTKPGAFPTV